MPEPLSILSTKSLGEGALEMVRSCGWTLREEHFIETKGVPHLELPIIGEDTLVVFTSEQGVGQVQAGATWHIACLSGKTLEAVHRHFRPEQIVCTGNNAAQLAEAITRDGRFTQTVFLCALEHRPDLPLALRVAGIAVEEVPVYETVQTPKAIDTPFDAILFFSPSAVDSFFQLNKLQPGTVCFVIGETTAGALKRYTDVQVVVSPFPSQEELLTCLRFYYDHHPIQE
jgi:uroporphyrinogen-III synthase